MNSKKITLMLIVMMGGVFWGFSQNNAVIINKGYEKLYYSWTTIGSGYQSESLAPGDSLKLLVHKNGLFVDDNNGSVEPTPFVLFPGDTLHVVLKNKKYIFQINDSLRKNDFQFLQASQDVFGSFKLIDKENFLGGYPVVLDKAEAKKIEDKYYKQTKKRLATAPKSNKERDEILYNIYQNKLNFLNEFESKKELSSLFKKYYQDFIYYQNLNVSLNGLIFSKTEIGAIPKNVKGDLSKYNIGDENLEHLAIYRAFLFNYFNYFGTQNKSTFARLQSVDSLIKNAPESKNWLLFRVIEQGFDKGAIASKDEINLFNLLCSNQSYRERIAEKAGNKSVLNKDDKNILYSLEKKQFTLEEIIKKQPAKRLYFIDFWASLCAPCIKEIKLSEAQNKEDEEVGFLYLSIDMDLESWKVAAKRFPKTMTLYNSFLLLNSDNAPILKRNKVETIPRYMVVDSRGKIIDDNAPRPSDPDFEKYLSRIKGRMAK